MSTAASQALVQKLYVAYYGRPADPAGLEAWALAIDANKGQVSTAIVNAFGASAESTALFGNMSTSQKVNAIYKQLFGRDAEPAGLLAWATAIDGGRVSAAGAALEILNGAAGDDKTTINNKLSAAAAFTAALDTTAEITAYSGDTVANAARSFLAGVTTAAPSTDAVNTAVASVTNTSGSGSNEAGKSYVLTTAQDVLTGTNSGDFFRAVAGVDVNKQDQTTLNSSDIIDGGAGADTLIVNMTGPAYNGGARIKNVETLQVGTNQPAATFDYNVNAGSNEVTGVNTVVYDQINNGTVNEVLNVNNITPSATGTVLPTLKWDNEAGSNAGTIGATFREAGVAGATTLNIVLDDVAAGAAGGIINIGGKVETFKITSQGTTANTLNNSANIDGSTVSNVDLISASEDGVANNGSLTKVIVDGAQAFGKAADVVATSTAANYGLTDRAANGASDLGIGNGTGATASNLISVAATVTEIDASASTGGVNVRFTGRNNGAEVSQVFKGGEGNDYAEFQVGNINATGGKGNDTFAFLANANNGTLTTADSIVGGEGTDTIQLGVNGNGTFNLETTEFDNKSGIDVLDLRGRTNTVKLSDGFVTASDAGLTVRTDKIIQTSATNSANDSTTTTNNLQENQSVNTIDLTALGTNRSVTVLGGSGSDRLLVDEDALNGTINFDGGTNAGNVAAGTGATAGDYDTLTVLNSAVLSRGDLANVKNIEGIVLTENVSGNSAFTVELTESFILNNTQAADIAAGTTDIDERVFQIITAAAANGTALTAADTINIDVTDLFQADGVTLKASLVGRQLDTNGAGATVTYTLGNQTNLTQAQLLAITGAAGDTFITGADAARTSVSGSGAAVTAGAVAAGIVLTADIVGGVYTGTANADTANVSANNTVSLGGGNDTLNVTAAITGASTIDLGAGNNIVNVNVANGLVTATDIVSTGSTTNTLNINADVSGAAFVIGTNMDIFQTVNFTVDQVSGGNLITINNNATTVTAVGGDFQLGTGGDTFTATGANVNLVTGFTGADIITAGTGADTLATVASTAAVTAGDGLADADVLTGGAGVDTFILRGDTASVAVGTGATAYSTAARVADFVLGTDVLQLSAAVANYATNAGTGLNATVTAAAAGATVIMDVAQSAGAAAIVAGTDLIKLTTAVATTTNQTVQQAFNAAIGTSTVTGLTASNEIFATYYDSTNSRAVVVMVDANATTNTIVETGDLVTLIGTINMSAADYAAFSNASLSIIAA